VTVAAALSHPYVDEGRLRYHTCMCHCCPNLPDGVRYTGDAEPVCPTPFHYVFEDELNSISRVKGVYVITFLPRDALVQSAVLRLHVVRLSVRPSVWDVGGSGSHRLEILETNYTIIYTNIFALRSPKAIHLIPGERGEI